MGKFNHKMFHANIFKMNQIKINQSNVNKYKMFGPLLLVLALIIISLIYKLFHPIGDKEFDKFISRLESKGYVVEVTDTKKDFISGERKWITLNKEVFIFVYIYTNNYLMEEDAGYLSLDGTTYKNPKLKIIRAVTWSDYPHFYKKGNIIVLYVGRDKKIINNLEEFYGEEFAGVKKMS